MPKQVKGLSVPGQPRTPKAERPPDPHGETPLFCFRYTDRASTNPWKWAVADKDASQLLDFLREMAQLTWRQIDAQTTGPGHKRRQKHHGQGTETFESDQRADIKRMKLGEIFGDEMFRFRLSGKRRLWGFRVGRVFHAVWWDPEHQVYPTDKE